MTEKGVHRASRNNQYAFEIHRDATKLDVKKAVEELFDVKVAKVRTQTRKGKLRRYEYPLRTNVGLEEGDRAVA